MAISRDGSFVLVALGVVPVVVVRATRSRSLCGCGFVVLLASHRPDARRVPAPDHARARAARPGAARRDASPPTLLLTNQGVAHRARCRARRLAALRGRRAHPPADQRARGRAASIVTTLTPFRRGERRAAHVTVRSRAARLAARQATHPAPGSDHGAAAVQRAQAPAVAAGPAARTRRRARA